MINRFVSVTAAAVLTGLSMSASADITLGTGGPDGTYIKLGQAMVKPLAKALDDAWAPQAVSVVEISGGTPENVKRACEDPNFIGLMQANFELPECAMVGASLPATEITIAVVNPWIAERVENWAENRSAVWQTVVQHKDKLNFHVRESGHLTTHQQVETMFGDLPEANDDVNKYGSSTDVLNAIAADQKGVSIFTVFPLPDEDFFATVKDLGLVITPVIHADMKTAQVNGQTAYTMSSSTPVEVGFGSDPVFIQSAQSQVQVVINANASAELKEALQNADFSGVVPEMGIMAKAALKIGGSVQSAQNSFSDAVDSGMSKVGEITN